MTLPFQCLNVKIENQFRPFFLQLFQKHCSKKRLQIVRKIGIFTFQFKIRTIQNCKIKTFIAIFPKLFQARQKLFNSLLKSLKFILFNLICFSHHFLIFFFTFNPCIFFYKVHLTSKLFDHQHY